MEKNQSARPFVDWRLKRGRCKEEVLPQAIPMHAVRGPIIVKRWLRHCFSFTSEASASTQFCSVEHEALHPQPPAYRDVFGASVDASLLCLLTLTLARCPLKVLQGLLAPSIADEKALRSLPAFREGQ
jgi:hypothetical protein